MILIFQAHNKAPFSIDDSIYEHVVRVLPLYEGFPVLQRGITSNRRNLFQIIFQMVKGVPPASAFLRQRLDDFFHVLIFQAFHILDKS